MGGAIGTKARRPELHPPAFPHVHSVDGSGQMTTSSGEIRASSLLKVWGAPLVCPLDPHNFPASVRHVRRCPVFFLLVVHVFWGSLQSEPKMGSPTKETPAWNPAW